MGVVLARAEVEKRIGDARRRGSRVVLTNGVFDLLHVGHTRYLARARALGDLLVVGVNSDASTRALKGPSRPLVPEDERAEVLAALCSVDYVTIFSESTADALLEALRPSIYVKGGDYAGGDDQELLVPPGELRRAFAGDSSIAPDAAVVEVMRRLPEAPTVVRLDCTLALISYVPGHSTTGLLDRIVTRHADIEGSSQSGRQSQGTAPSVTPRHTAQRGPRNSARHP